MSDTDLTPDELIDSAEPAIDSADAIDEATTEADMEATTEAVTAEVEEAVEAPQEAAEEIAVVETSPVVKASPVVEELADADVAGEDELFESDEPVKVESPFDRAGRWYVVHTQSGHEKKAQQNLAARTASMNMEDRIFESVIPMEDVVEFKNGKKVVVQKKMFPGYLLVRAVLDDDAWYVVRNTPSVVNFVGSGGKPSPLMRREVEDFLQVKEEGGPATPNKRSKARLEYEMGETVRVKEGPFADFSGEIVEINEDQLKVKVLVNIFGRETPVELEFSQIARL
ncbi:MAG: transcriptional antiterminator NusG [Verrucomicrobiales bacterium]|jgi:transcriptional antiterminator NusG